MERHCKFCQRIVEVKQDPFSNAEICVVCGAIVVDSYLPEGTIVSGFQIEKEIGRGGMGVVYKAKQLNLERHVALKILSDELSRDSDFVDRFFREARAAASLSHQNIVQAFDAGATPEGIYYFAMELIEGETIDDRIERSGPMPFLEALDVISKIADALSYAWDKQKLCHGDIKPENIIVNIAGEAKLADLGLAKTIHDEHDKDMMATPMYAPPEVIMWEKHRVGMQSDMYSFGATVYHMLSGKPPFPDDEPEVVMKRHLEETPKPLIEVVPGIPAEFSAFCDQLLAKEPEERPESWGDISRFLSEVRSIIAAAARSERSGDEVAAAPEPGKKSKISLITKIVLPLFIILLLLAVYYLGQVNGVEDKYSEESANGLESVGPDSEPDVVKQWEMLKIKIKFLDPEKAYYRLKDFSAKYGDKTPADVELLTQDLKRQMDETRQIGEFEKKIEAFDLEIHSAELKKLPEKKLLELKIRINEILTELENDIKLQPIVPREYRRIYSNKASDIDKIISDRRKAAEERRRLKEFARKRKLEAAKRKKRAEERARRQKIARLRNRCNREYYRILSDFQALSLNERRKSVLKEKLENWQKKYNKVSSPVTSRGKLLLRMSDVIYHNLISVFTRHNNLLKGKSLPGTSLAKYHISSVDSDAMRLVLTEGKVTIGKKLRWKRLKPDAYIAMIGSLLMPLNTEGKLDVSSQWTVLFWLLVHRRFEASREWIKPFSGKDGSRKVWLEIINDWESAAAEAEAGQIWTRIDEDLEAGKFENAGKLLGELTSKFGTTKVVRQNRKAIGRNVRMLECISPAMQVNMINEACWKAIKDGAGVKALNLAMTAYSRYGNLKELDSETKAAVLRNVNSALAMLKERTKVKAIGDNKVPFYHGSAENPGDAWIFERIIRKSKIFGKSHPIRPYLLLASEIDLGNWEHAREILTRYGKDFYYLTKDIGPLKSWSPSLLFGFGVTAKRYLDGSLTGKVADALFELAGSTTEEGELKKYCAILAMEYALMIRKPEMIEDFVAKYNFKANHTPLDGKIALLHLLAIVQQEKRSVKEYLRALQRYRQIFKPVKQVENDFYWCGTAVTCWVKGAVLGKTRLNMLIKRDCFAPVISARILSAALAKGMLTYPGTRKNAGPLLDLLEKQVGDNLTCGPLWIAVEAQRFSIASDHSGLAKQISLSLKDYRICAIKYYPRLQMLSAGKEIYLQNLTAGKMTGVYEKFIQGCPMANRVELLFPQYMEDKINPVTALAALFDKGCPDNAFWFGFAMLLANADNVKESQEILKLLRTYSARLTCEERLLLKSFKEKLK